jgi:hypothetical protein
LKAFSLIAAAFVVALLFAFAASACPGYGVAGVRVRVRAPVAAYAAEALVDDCYGGGVVEQQVVGGYAAPLVQRVVGVGYASPVRFVRGGFRRAPFRRGRGRVVAPVVRAGGGVRINIGRRR